MTTTSVPITKSEYSAVVSSGTTGQYLSVTQPSMVIFSTTKPANSAVGHPIHPDLPIPIASITSGVLIWVKCLTSSNAFALLTPFSDIVIGGGSGGTTTTTTDTTSALTTARNAASVESFFEYISSDYEWAAQAFQNPGKLGMVSVKTTNTTGWTYVFLLDANMLPADSTNSTTGLLSASILIDEIKLPATSVPYVYDYQERPFKNGLVMVGSTTPFPQLTTPTGSAATMLFQAYITF